MQNNIVLITDNEKVAQKINKKVLLLRNEDKLQTIKHADCFDIVKKIKPVLVLYHLKLNREDDFLNFLQKLKQNKKFFKRFDGLIQYFDDKIQKSKTLLISLKFHLTYLFFLFPTYLVQLLRPCHQHQLLFLLLITHLYFCL